MKKWISVIVFMVLTFLTVFLPFYWAEKRREEQAAITDEGFKKIRDSIAEVKKQRLSETATPSREGEPKSEEEGPSKILGRPLKFVFDSK